jgi:SpoVK/Ycf46/Vps4 family AAA+-type ATPase
VLSHDGRPTPGLIAHLLSSNEEERLSVRRLFTLRGKLRRYGLVDVITKTGWAETEGLVTVPRFIGDLLLGEDKLDAGGLIRGIAEEAPKLKDLLLSVRQEDGPAVLVYGVTPADRKATAAALAARFSYSAFCRIAPKTTDMSEIQVFGRELFRDAALRGGVPVALLDDVDERHLPGIVQVLAGGSDQPGGSLILTVPHDISGSVDPSIKRIETCEAVSVDYSSLRRRWSKGIEQAAISVSDNALDTLAGRFRLEPWGVGAALKKAIKENSKPGLEEISRAARAMAPRRAVSHARRVSPRYTLEDMVLPKSVRDHLTLMLGFAAERERLLHDYGYAKKFTIGHGLVTLLCGESGTGKTMAAEVLANTLDKDLYIVDLSQLVSKWVGETEKHIDQVFSEAEEAQGVLLFDEADSLFAGRSNSVESSNDRYANMEVGYLLQRIESFHGVAVLTTNLSQNIDDAFLRRFHFRIDVPRPNAKLRAELWEKMLPKGGYETENLDLQTLAGRFDLTGGNIRNALLKATYLADRDDTSINQHHLIEAAVLECLELGRLV